MRVCECVHNVYVNGKGNTRVPQLSGFIYVEISHLAHHNAKAE